MASANRRVFNLSHTDGGVRPLTKPGARPLPGENPEILSHCQHRGKNGKTDVVRREKGDNHRRLSAVIYAL